jgi:hypothetical protein
MWANIEMDLKSLGSMRCNKEPLNMPIEGNEK